MQVAAIKKAKSIPTSLIYEELNGAPVYYRGYEAVLKKLVKQESIMGSSKLQSYITSLIFEFLILNLGKSFKVLSGELGLNISKNNNLAADIAIFEKNSFFQSNVDSKYAQIAPKIVIEIDTKADTSLLGDLHYYQTKTDKLLEYGVEKVVWIFTNTQTIMVAEPNQPWIIDKWNHDFKVLDQIINLENLLIEDGFDITQLNINN
jgi:Uma2 family endonuclease